MSKIRERLFAQLDELEDSLRTDLVRHLKASDRSGLDVFCTPETNPFPELKRHASGVGASLYTRAQEVLKLADQLGEPTDHLVASRFISYCQRWADLKDHHRPSPESLVSALLSELESRK